MKTLIAYFSFTAGNTKKIAEKIQAKVGGDLLPLSPVKAYSGIYDQVVEEGEEEVKRGYKPELKPLGINLKDYDRIIVGSPTWWYTMAPVVLSFLSNNEFSGQTVVPFMTNAGWPGTVLKDMTAVAQQNGASVTDGREFKFSSKKQSFDQMLTPEKVLTEWLQTLEK